MDTVNVDLGERSYPIYIGAQLLGQPGLLRQHIKGSRAVIVTNDRVAPLYLDAVKAGLDGLPTDEVILPDGEEHKTLQTANLIYDALLKARHERSTTLIALGGGVTGDITGFAAATYQRGVNFVQIPTTLLAQVDSSVGGKTGVNHPLGKNMIGAFYQPQCVLADTSVLRTLPPRELAAGLAEVIKYGALGNLAFFEWLEQNMAGLLRGDADLMAYAIRVSCQEKARIVAADEREGGVRALLNLGHTFGHAIETAVGYGVWLHGEAVGTGMVMAADLSWRLGWIRQEEALRVRRLVEAATLPVAAPEQMSAEDFMRLMAVDKKVQDGRIRFVLLKSLGEAVVSSDTDRQALALTLGAGARLCLA